jgi:hypothetical protein
MAILGQFLQLLLVKIPMIKRKCNAANKNFSWVDWWNCDWHIVIGTMVLVALLIVGLDEFLNWKPNVLEYIKWFFAGIGAFGSTVTMAYLSKYESQIMALLDIKSNVSDAVTGGTNTVKETVEKGEAATGQEIKPGK